MSGGVKLLPIHVVLLVIENGHWCMVGKDYPFD